VVNQMIYVATI